MITTRENIDRFKPEDMVNSSRMTIGEYSKWRSWPVPFGMKKNKKGYRVTYADGSATWFSRNHFEQVFGGKAYE